MKRVWTSGLTSVREALENADNDSLKVMDQFKMDLYEDEVFVFTPKGDFVQARQRGYGIGFLLSISIVSWDASVSARK